MKESMQQKAKELPLSPGVYIFRDRQNSVIYVGKAKLLRNRVSSYFHNDIKLGTKTQALVARVCSLETINTSSEIDALILEAELIKKYRPKYNISLKDDKSYLYIVIRNEVLLKGKQKIELPKIFTARNSDLKKNDITFGPYPSTNDARTVLKLLRKIFPFRDCSAQKFSKHAKLTKPCLFGHLGLCQAPCADKCDANSYKKEIKQLSRFLSGYGEKLIKEYKKKMMVASKSQNYELAAEYRDVLRKLQYVRENYKGASRYIDNPNLVEDIAEESLKELQINVPLLSNIPRRIECYDISNISGRDAVGSMVVAIDGLIEKKEYRRFKIKSKNTPDDYFMLKEVLKRRLHNSFSNTDSERWEVPNLLVIDGGKGQVSAVLDILNAMNKNIPLVGLAKKEEAIIFIDSGEFVSLKLPRNNSGLKLLITLRDEAHRFAQSYHHKLRLKKIQ